MDIMTLISIPLTTNSSSWAIQNNALALLSFRWLVRGIGPKTCNDNPEDHLFGECIYFCVIVIL